MKRVVSALAATLVAVILVPAVASAQELQIGVTASPGTARAPGRAGGFCRGLEVTLEFDPRSWQASGLYLLCSVLEHFLALHGTVNSFTRTRATLRGRPGVVAAWQARSGTRLRKQHEGGDR